MVQKLKYLMKSYLSEEHFEKIVYARRFILSLHYTGLRFKCSICGGHFRVFLPAGLAHRSHASCPRCGSLERHRLIWMYLQERTNFFSSKLSVLHFAPEYCFQRVFKSLSNLDYISADLYDPSAMIKIDITDIKFQNNTFDCILCSHVLEHILDDNKAIRELYRVLKPNGWAILQVPILREKTFEDSNVQTPEERLKYFGQEDHVRIYGLDYKDRLENAGFKVMVDPYLMELDEDIVQLYKLVPENEPKENIYYCIK